MVHYFIVNPKSGKKHKVNVLDDVILPAVKKVGITYEIHETTGPGDATRFTREVAEKAQKKGEKIRIYSVGGDGTLYEVVNGAIGFDNVEITVVPTGSGNDYIRIYGGDELFRNVENLINGTPVQVDCLKLTDQDGREEIALNQASMGFDAEACSMQGSMKKLPGAMGHLTYTLGGLYCMFTKLYFRYKVTLDGKEIPGPFIQVTDFIGQYYGSGILGGRFVDPTDGLADVVVIHRCMSWPIVFVYMLFHWQQKFDFYKYSYCDYLRGKKLTIASEKPIALNVDGECRPVTKCDFEVVPKAFTFVIPSDSTYLSDVASGKISHVIDQGPDCQEPRKSKLNNRHLFEHIVNRGIFGYRR